jgi:hypothetical protein
MRWMGGCSCGCLYIELRKAAHRVCVCVPVYCYQSIFLLMCGFAEYFEVLVDQYECECYWTGTGP